MWEILKGTIRNESIKYSCKLQKTQRQKEENIEKEINRLHTNIAVNPNSQDLSDKLKLEESNLIV